jgi:hypothetical protein
LDNNLFALSFDQIGKYHEYLLAIKSRFDEESKPYIEAGRRITTFAPSTEQADADLVAFFDLSRKYSHLIHLDIESFYVFAKIVLDKIAHCIEHYFGHGRGCSLRSHDFLVKNFNKFSQQKALIVPPDLLGKAIKLKEQIADFRDKQIEHNRNPRTIMGTSFGSPDGVVMFLTQMFPREGDPGQIASTPLHKLLAAIDGYMLELFSLVRENRLKSVFKVAPTSAC